MLAYHPSIVESSVQMSGVPVVSVLVSELKSCKYDPPKAIAARPAHAPAKIKTMIIQHFRIISFNPSDGLFL